MNSRVRVIDFVYGEKKIEYVVQLLDYATVRVVQAECIYYLREMYNELPIQVVKMEVHGKTRLSIE